MNQLMSVIETRVRDRLNLQGFLEQTSELEQTSTRPEAPRPTTPDANHAPPTLPLSTEEAAARLEHRALTPQATHADLEARCAEAAAHGLQAISVYPGDAALAAHLLGSDSAQISVLIDPLGAASSATRAFAAQEAAHQGADALDVALLGGALNDLNYAVVCDDLRGLISAASPVPVTVTLGTDALPARTLTIACALAQAAGAAAVNLIAHSALGARASVSLMRAVVGGDVGVKVTTEPITADELSALFQAGASCVCTAQGPALLSGWTSPETGLAEPTIHNPTSATGA